jgi:uncharacterized protein YegL
MNARSLFKQGRSMAARFRRAESGNVAIFFAIAILPMLALVGAAIDYARVNNARTALQTALDTAALMVSKDASIGTLTDDQVTQKAQAYFKALYNHPEAPVGPIDAKYTPNSGKGASIVLSGGGAMDTDFMRVAGYPTINFGSSSTTTWGNTRMRVAMALDNTGSMAQNNKMSNMQTAAKDMITTLSGYNKTDGDVYVSIIPFAKDVNVGMSNVNAAWLNWTEWEAEPAFLTQNGYPNDWKYTGPGSDCPFNKNSHGFACTDRPATKSGAKNADEIPDSGTYAGLICPSVDNGRKLSGKSGIYYNGCYTSVVDQTKQIDSGRNASCGSTKGCTCSGTGNNRVCTQTTYKHYWRYHPTNSAITAAAAPAHSTWTGCVNDRDQSYDTLNTAWSAGTATPSTMYYAEQWRDCLPATVTGMSNKWSDLRTQIADMVPSGNTNQSIGFAWAWQTLNTSNGPFQAQGKDKNYVYKDYLVLLSDGMNTQNRWTQNSSDIDDRQAIQCKNIKDNGITVFTIQVNINNKDPLSTVLQNCASNGNFQMITTAGQTADAFQNILNQIAKLRISK